MTFYKRIGIMIPRFILDAFKKQMDYMGLKTSEFDLVGFVFFFGFGLSLGISLFFCVLMPDIPVIATFSVLFLFFSGAVYYWLNMGAENRGRFVEQVLPDVLQLVSSNMRAGLTTERALMASARPEFGVFSEELKLASGKVMAGERMEEALNEIAQKIKSPVLERTTWLMIQGIKSGGEVADLLSQLADDLREENAMKEEAKAEVNMYVLLIFFAVALGAPILFSVSSYIVGILNQQTQNLAVNPEQLKEFTQRSAVGRIVGMPSVSITEEFATNFALISLICCCFFGSLTIGVINSGKEKDGIKLIPIIITIAVALFFTVRFILAQVMGGIGKMM